MLVRISREKDFDWFDFQLPKQLAEHLEFQDFERAFGEGIESPRAKEPFCFSVMYHIRGVGEVAIISTSRKPPSVQRPCIYQITVI